MTLNDLLLLTEEYDIAEKCFENHIERKRESVISMWKEEREKWKDFVKNSFPKEIRVIINSLSENWVKGKINKYGAVGGSYTKVNIKHKGKYYCVGDDEYNGSFKKDAISLSVLDENGFIYTVNYAFNCNVMDRFVTTEHNIKTATPEQLEEIVSLLKFYNELLEDFKTIVCDLYNSIAEERKKKIEKKKELASKYSKIDTGKQNVSEKKIVVTIEIIG